MAEEDVVVTVEERAPEPSVQDQGAGVTEKVEKATEVKAKVAETADPVEDLKDQLAAAKDAAQRDRAARVAAEQQAREALTAANQAAKEAQAAKTEATDTQFSSIKSGIEAATSESDAASAALQAALETGDFGKVPALQKQVSRAEAQKVRLEEALADLESRKPAGQTQQQQPSQRQISDPVEAYIQGRTAPTAAWLREHTDYITDSRKNQKLTGAHYDALAEGYQPDTPEYFSHVEQFLGLGDKPEKAEPAPKTNGSTRRQAPPPVASVTNTGGGTSGGRSEVRLSQGEVRSANDGTITWGRHDLAAGRIKDAALIGQPIGNAEMARRKLEMSRQGLYDPVNFVATT